MTRSLETLTIWITGAALVAFIVIQAMQGAWFLAGVLTVGMVWVLVAA